MIAITVIGTNEMLCCLDYIVFIYTLLCSQLTVASDEEPDPHRRNPYMTHSLLFNMPALQDCLLFVFGLNLFSFSINY